MGLNDTKTQDKRTLLEEALERLLQNKPIRVKEGLFSVSAVEKEAGLPNATLKYHLYDDIRERILQEIDRRKLEGMSSKRERRGSAGEQRLREERNTERSRKKRYREERDQYKAMNAKNLAMVQGLAETLDSTVQELDDAKQRIKEIEAELLQYRTSGGNNVVTLR